MAKLIKTKTTTTVTEEIELSPAVPGKEISHRCMTVNGYGEYTGDDGRQHVKPKINLNAKWLADAGLTLLPRSASMKDA